MTNAKMHAVQVQDAAVFLKRALTPGVKLLGERLVETTDRTGTGRASHERLRHFPDFVRADSGHKHLGQSLRHLRFIAAVALEDLGVELPLPVSGNLELLDPTGCSGQITAVGAIAIPFALGAACSPAHPDERVEFLAHHSSKTTRTALRASSRRNCWKVC